MKKKQKIDATIIIRTKNEERWIESCLNKVFQQKKISFEVIIIDNYSKDKTLFKAKKYPVKVLKIKKFFPGKAINLGIRHANGKYIVCLSAHCIPENNFWLFNLTKNLLSKKVAAVYGKQRPLPYSSSFDKRDLYNTFGDDKRIQKKDTFFHNANSAIKKVILKKNKFDERTPHIEDRIWANTIIKKKYNIIYEPKASVFHWHGINQEMNKERCDKIVEILESLNKSYVSKNIHSLSKLNIISIIPSKGDLLRIDNKPIIFKTIESLKESKFIKKIFVSTDNFLTKKNVEKFGATVPFLRPKNLSEDHIDIITILRFTLEKLEKIKIVPDLIVLMTENFPLREKKILDIMLKKAIDNNYDALIVGKKEKGTIFLENKLIADGTIPNKMKNNKILISRLGICTILRPEQIRKSSIFDGKIGTYEIENDLAFIEFKKDNLNKLKKFL